MKPLTMTEENFSEVARATAEQYTYSEPVYRRWATELVAEVDALRAALAAAESALADERKHADALADKLSILALGRINRTEVTAHFARRNAEKEER